MTVCGESKVIIFLVRVTGEPRILSTDRVSIREGSCRSSVVAGTDASVNGVLKGGRGIPIEVLACSDNPVAELTNLIEVRVVATCRVVREAFQGIMVLILTSLEESSPGIP